MKGGCQNTVSRACSILSNPQFARNPFAFPFPSTIRSASVSPCEHDFASFEVQKQNVARGCRWARRWMFVTNSTLTAPSRAILRILRGGRETGERHRRGCGLTLATLPGPHFPWVSFILLLLSCPGLSSFCVVFVFLACLAPGNFGSSDFREGRGTASIFFGTLLLLLRLYPRAAASKA